MIIEQWALIPAIVTLCAFILTLISGTRRKFLSAIFLLSANVFLAIVLALRWYTTGRVPWATLYESIVLLALTICIVLVYMLRQSVPKPLLVLLSAFNVIMLTGSMLLWEASPEISSLLDSGWIIIHVPVVILSYCMFTVSAASAMVLIAFKMKGMDNAEMTGILDRISNNCIVLGLGLIIPGIIMGALWANAAWGSYWSWDPKETWALITAAIYALYIILRRTGMGIEDAALLSIMGFLSVIFTYIGVSYLIPGLHSYA